MAKTNKLEDLITYKILADKKAELEKELGKTEESLRLIERALDNSKPIARLLYVDRKRLEDFLARWSNRVDTKRIKLNLELINVEKALLEIELKTYTEED